MNFGNILRTTARVGKTLAEVETGLGVPGAQHIETIAHIINRSSADDKDKEAAAALLENLADTRLTPAPIAAWDSKRFKSVVLFIGSVVVLQASVRFLNLPQDVALQMMQEIGIVTGAYMVMESLRPSQP